MSPVNEVALVTGDSSGLGKAAAYAFADAGFGVIVVDVSVDGAQDTAERTRGQGTEALFVETDVSEPHEVAALIDAATATYRDACSIARHGCPQTTSVRVVATTHIASAAHPSVDRRDEARSPAP